ncbi:hypothetical protein P3G55_07560 [Leptospira sp. 96542]|nr:hypothetical protein [Leptospira sp. 96542]
MFALTLSCNQQNKQYDDSYAETILLQYLTTVNNPQGTCLNLIANKDTCFTTSGLATNSTEAEKNAQCTTMRTSSQYNTMSTISQTCVFDCQSKDWSYKQSSGECKTSNITSLVISSLSNNVVLSCIRSCFSPTSNIVTNENAAQLLLFNIIQNGD